MSNLNAMLPADDYKAALNDLRTGREWTLQEWVKMHGDGDKKIRFTRSANLKYRDGTPLITAIIGKTRLQVSSRADLEKLRDGLNHDSSWQFQVVELKNSFASTPDKPVMCYQIHRNPAALSELIMEVSVSDDLLAD